MQANLTVTPIRALRDNYVWLLTRGGGADAVVVDPGEAAPVVIALERRSLRLAAIVVTHHHHDHVGGILPLLARYDANVIGPAGEPIPGRSIAAHDGDAIVIGAIDLHLRAMHVPGHTLGATAYYTAGMVFTGDTLFTAGCGRLFEGSALQMHESLQRLAALPEDTLVYCGHEYTAANLQFAAAVEPGNAEISERIREVRKQSQTNTPCVPATIRLEKQTNPFLRVGEGSVRRAVESQCGRVLRTDIEVFAALREWKNHF